jgi:hypothetical protein
MGDGGMHFCLCNPALHEDAPQPIDCALSLA